MPPRPSPSVPQSRPRSAPGGPSPAFVVRSSLLARVACAAAGTALTVVFGGLLLLLWASPWTTVWLQLLLGAFAALGVLLLVQWWVYRQAMLIADPLALTLIVPRALGWTLWPPMRRRVIGWDEVRGVSLQRRWLRLRAPRSGRTLALPSGRMMLDTDRGRIVVQANFFHADLLALAQRLSEWAGRDLTVYEDPT